MSKICSKFCLFVLPVFLAGLAMWSVMNLPKAPIYPDKLPFHKRLFQNTFMVIFSGYVSAVCYYWFYIQYIRVYTRILWICLCWMLLLIISVCYRAVTRNYLTGGGFWEQTNIGAGVWHGPGDLLEIIYRSEADWVKLASTITGMFNFFNW